MEQPVQNAEKTVSDAAPTVDARLEHIENSLNKINERMDNSNLFPKEDHQNTSKKASKGLLAGTFALVGLKVGAFIGGKIGFMAFDAPRAYQRGGVKEIYHTFLDLITLGHASKSGASVFKGELKYTMQGAFAGSMLMPIIGALIGWARGDRLEKPSDLFAHPIESMKKIFGPDPRKHTAKAAEKNENTAAIETSNNQVMAPLHEGVLVAADRAIQH